VCCIDEGIFDRGKMIKLNVGASPIWTAENWHTLDHKVRNNIDYSLVGTASKIPLEEKKVSTIFCSHMFEHIPHVELEEVLLEFNRVLDFGGILRVLTPDLKKIATAYVNNDLEFFRKAKSEDESLRQDLGIGGMLMNFIVSPGQDTALYDRGLSRFIAGYAHLYSYDFEMLKILLQRTGFGEVNQMKFCESKHKDYQIPMHVIGMEPKWQDLNQEFYKNNNLKHYYDDHLGKYVINFKITGFDRDPLTSLIIEASKTKDVLKDGYDSLNQSHLNYNRYAWSLLKDENFSRKNKSMLDSVRDL